MHYLISNELIISCKDWGQDEIVNNIKALDKAGKSIPSMSDDEKKAFFDKIDAAWNGKGEKNEAKKKKW